VREEGVAMDVGEYIFNVWCVAVPIFYGKTNRKRLVGGFWVVGLNSEEGPQRIQTAMRLARATGDALSRAISQYNTDQSF
jgi:DNA-binding IclR family transcriptional regulator